MLMHMACRVLKDSGYFSEALYPCMSMIAGLGGAVDFSRCALYDILEATARGGPGASVRSWVDDVTLRVEGRARRAVGVLEAAGLAFAEGCREAGLVISSKSTIISGDNEVAKQLQQHFADHGFQVKVQEVAADLGIDRGRVGARRPKQSARRAGAGRRLVRLRRFARSSVRRRIATKVALMGVLPMGGYSDRVYGAAPSVILRWRRAIAQTVAKKWPGRCLTTLLQLKVGAKDPQVQMVHQVVESWMQVIFSAKLDLALARITWARAKEKLEGRKRTSRSKGVTGIVTATIATLLDLGWSPTGPWDWTSDDGVQLRAPDSMIGQGPQDMWALKAELSASIQRYMWKRAAQHWHGKGLEGGARTSRVPVGTSRCNSDFRKVSRNLKKRASSDVDALPCLWLRGILPASWTYVEEPPDDPLGDQCGDAASLQGRGWLLVGGDASGGEHSASAKLRRVGWGYAVVDCEFGDVDGVHQLTSVASPFGHGGGLAGPRQTINRGETQALLAALVDLQCLGAGITYVTDSSYVVRGFGKIVRGVLPRTNIDLWQKIKEALQGAPHLLSTAVVKIESHLDQEVAEVPSSTVTSLEMAEAIGSTVRTHLTMAFLKASEAEPRRIKPTRAGHRGFKVKLALSEHELSGRVGSSFHCKGCGCSASGPRLEVFLATPCHKGVLQGVQMVGKGKITVQGVEIHSSHLLGYWPDLKTHACLKCGHVGRVFLRGLAQPCGEHLGHYGVQTLRKLACGNWDEPTMGEEYNMKVQLDTNTLVLTSKEPIMGTIPAPPSPPLQPVKKLKRWHKTLSTVKLEHSIGKKEENLKKKKKKKRGQTSAIKNYKKRLRLKTLKAYVHSLSIAVPRESQSSSQATNFTPGASSALQFEEFLPKRPTIVKSFDAMTVYKPVVQCMPEKDSNQQTDSTDIEGTLPNIFDISEGDLPITSEGDFMPDASEGHFEPDSHDLGAPLNFDGPEFNDDQLGAPLYFDGPERYDDQLGLPPCFDGPERIYSNLQSVGGAVEGDFGDNGEGSACEGSPVRGIEGRGELSGHSHDGGAEFVGASHTFTEEQLASLGPSRLAVLRRLGYLQNS
ncbi:unnamed protein product [Prorocentrum cordatum]|uniref:RNase H type-1 domain-containing protein n=1 Tax=Prorocentrum cordatum TaxID=2364126 RepID=A0ABN9VEA9_9DINO|nr:unnamed protein product [Polarella glacialis]